MRPSRFMMIICMVCLDVFLFGPPLRAGEEPGDRQEEPQKVRPGQEQEKGEMKPQEKKKEPTVQDLLDRIEALELEVQDLREQRTGSPRKEEAPQRFGADLSTMGVSPDLMGNLGQTTRFSRTFNPAVGAVLDLIGNIQTGKESGPHQDGFWLRSAELNLAAQIDPYGYAYAVFAGNDEDNVSVAEAGAVLNRLPWNFSLKGGRILADFGKFGQRHEHELPFVEKPGVYYDYIGGSIQATGVEIHQWFGLTDEIPLRWSVGVYNELDSHGHRLGAEDYHGEAGQTFGRRRFNDLAYDARLTGYGDLSDRSSLQVGSSLIWAPEIQDVYEQPYAGRTSNIATHKAVAGVDATYKWIDPSSLRKFFFGAEGFRSTGRYFDKDAFAYDSSQSMGGYTWCEYSFNPYWAVGSLAGIYQLAKHEDVGRREISAWVTWNLSHFNRLRFQYRFNDLERWAGSTGNDYHEFILQWVVVFGTHAHAINW